MMKVRLGFALVGLSCLATASLLANGGAWQVGVPLTGNAAPSDKAKTTEVALEEENLTIDLHQEFGAVEVRYRMRNTGPKVTQDFFFPVERWTPLEGEEDGMGEKPADLEDYKITADGAEVKWKNITGPVPKMPEPTPEPEESATPEARSDRDA